MIWHRLIFTVRFWSVELFFFPLLTKMLSLIFLWFVFWFIPSIILDKGKPMILLHSNIIFKWLLVLILKFVTEAYSGGLVYSMWVNVILHFFFLYVLPNQPKPVHPRKWGVRIALTDLLVTCLVNGWFRMG